jgi:hypothetical protein
MQVECGNCGRNYTVPNRLAGKRLRCKNCSKAIAVPELEEEEPPPHAILDLAEGPPEFSRVEAESPPDAVLDLAQDPPEFSKAEAETPPPLGNVIPPRLAPAGHRARSAADSQSLGAFRSRIRDNRTALVAFAKATAGRFGYGSVTPDCCNCHREGDAGVYEFLWRASLRNGPGFHWASLITVWFGAVIVSNKSELIAYKTYHRLCGGCRATSVTLGALGSIGAIFAGVFLCIGVFLIAIGAALQPASKGVSPLLVTGIIVVVISMIVMFLMRRLKVLSALRRVGPHPFAQSAVNRVA